MVEDSAHSKIWLGCQKDKPAVSVRLPVSTMLRHMMALGSSGSGKTVLCKGVVEEMVRSGLPAICLDPQGDLCSLVKTGDPAELERRGVDPALMAQFRECADPVIFTPASRKGIPLCADPIERATSGLDDAALLQSSSRSATMVVRLLGYDPESDDGAGLTAVFDSILRNGLQRGSRVSSLGELERALSEIAASDIESWSRYVDSKKIKIASQRLARLDVGARRMLFHEGVPIDIDVLLGRDELTGPPPGKARISIVYLNTLHSQEDKDFFVGALVERLYSWMIRNPSPVPQALFYIDEVAPFIPPVRKPSAKEGLQLLFKQARKYGVCCLMATQNPGDVDYKAMAQFGTWAIGRLTTRQDLKKIEPTIKALAPTGSDAILATLPALRPGEFVLLSPDELDEAPTIQARWLYTSHETYDEERIERFSDRECRGRFAELELRQPRQEETELARESGDLVGGDEGDAAARQLSSGPDMRQSEAAILDSSSIESEPEGVRIDETIATTVAIPVAEPTRPNGGFDSEVIEAEKERHTPVPATQRDPLLADQRPVLGVLLERVSADPQLPATPEQWSADGYRSSPDAAVERSAMDRESARMARVLARRPLMTAAEFATIAGLGEKKARVALKALVDGGLAAVFKDGRSQSYWATSTGARPDLGLFGTVTAIAQGVDAAGVVRFADEHRRSKLLGVIGQDESFDHAELQHRLVYKIDFEEEVERSLLGRLFGPTHDRRLGSVYVHPRQLTLVVFSPGQGIRFSAKPAGYASDVDDFDGVTHFTELMPAALAFEADDWHPSPLTVEAKNRVKHEFKRRYAATPGRVTPVFVPVWKVVLRTGDGKGFRWFTLDGIVGRPLQWP